MKHFKLIGGGLLQRLIPLTMVVLLTVSAVGTRGASAQDQDPKALLDQAATAMSAAKSFHFELSTPRGESLITDQIKFDGAEGDVLRPDSFKATFTAKAAFISLTVKVIGIGANVWVTDPMQAEESWINVTGGSEGATPIPEFLNPDRLLQAAVSLIENPAINGNEDIDGHKTTRVEGTFNPSRMNELVGTPVAEFGELTAIESIPVTIWIDETNRVVRVEFAGPLTSTESGDVIHRLDISKFDDPVTIEAPA